MNIDINQIYLNNNLIINMAQLFNNNLKIKKL